MNFKKLFQSDYIGITASVACLLHCLLSPFLLGALFVAQSETDTLFNLEYVFLVISAFSVWQSTRHQHSKAIQLILWFSLSLLIGSVLLEDYAPFFEYLVYLAGIGLTTGHWLNIRLCQKSYIH
ncbi:MAG: MerC domain-containing protein [Bacteroidetes bacterium]|nr:MAG: MerC domain-containing protein [Bacteroidota bacterium]